jgi:hypothetical protein
MIPSTEADTDTAIGSQAMDTDTTESGIEVQGEEKHAQAATVPSAMPISTESVMEGPREEARRFHLLANEYTLQLHRLQQFVLRKQQELAVLRTPRSVADDARELGEAVKQFGECSSAYLL